MRSFVHSVSRRLLFGALISTLFATQSCNLLAPVEFTGLIGLELYRISANQQGQYIDISIQAVP